VLLVCLATTLPVLGSWVGGEQSSPPLGPALLLKPSPLFESPAVEGDWLARVQRGLAEREYQASPNRTGLQAPNRAHGLRTYFEPTGIRVHDRTAAGSPELLSLALASVGRPERMERVGPGEVKSEGACVEIRRQGLVEWYANSPVGLEQGFTVEEPPEGGGSLVMELAVKGARALSRGDRVIFRAETGRRLEYGQLSAVDAEGRALVARMEVPEPSRVRLEVEDEAAVYPVVIDPLLAATADAQLESNQIGAELGFSVAGAGDVNGDGYADVIVGAPWYDAGESAGGAAFIFLGSTSGIADGDPTTAHAQLESDQIGASLGFSVAGAGDVNGDGYADIIVGTHAYNAGQENEGAAFVFLGSASGIADGNPTTAHARLESDQIGGYLGVSVAGAGDVNGDGYDDVIVGAHAYDTDEPSEGAAFVFLGSASGIADGNPSTAHAQLESNQVNADLGTSVAGAGDVNGDGYADVIVGAPDFDSGEENEGAAFVFLGSASGIADGDPSNAHAQLESNQAHAFLGLSVAGAGDVNGDGYADVIVGAYWYDAGETDEGAAFLFLGSASGIPDGNPSTAHAQLESDQANAESGNSVAGAGDVNGDGYADVIVGARLYDTAEGNEGAAFVYLGGASGIAAGLAIGDPATAHAQLESDQTDANLGRSVAAAGDVNGDGFTDVIVGAPNYDAGQANEGAAFVFLGSVAGIADGDSSSAHARLESNQVDAKFGWSVAGAGDVNGDGYADVIVGAPYYDADEMDEGAAFVFLGSASGIADGDPSTAATQLESNQANAVLGDSVAGAGDVNGDGYADVIVGAPYYDADETDEGAAFVFLGSTSGIGNGNPTSAHARFESDQADAALGSSVAGAGDVNGDGYADVIVGAPYYDSDEMDEGAAFVFLGSAAGIADGNPANAHARLESNQVAARLSMRAAGAGDVNGDSYADVIVGAPYYDAGETDEGAAFVFLGSASGIGNGNPTSAHARFESDQADAELGSSVAGAGDVNGDGYADVIVGSPEYHAVGPGEGAAFVFLGSASGIGNGDPSTAHAQLESNQVDAWLGLSVAGAGDVNGDGFADIIVGASAYTAGEPNEGAAFVFLGNGEGRPVLAQQLRGGAGSRPVPPWGPSYHGSAFRVSLHANHPEGRGRVKLEVECCEAGLPFDDPGCARKVGTSWADVTATSDGVILTETIDGLASGELYRWRARVLHAPYSVTQPGIVAPPSPAHGPWRRVSAQALEADVRVLPPPPTGPLDKGQQKCVNAMNKSGEKVNGAQLKDVEKCLKDFQKGKLAHSTFETCTAVDRMGKVQKAEDKTVAVEAKKCSSLAEPPLFAYTDALTVNQVARDGGLALVHVLFGDPVQDADLATQAAGKETAACQGEMLKRAHKLEKTVVKELDKVKKQALKDPTVDGAGALQTKLEEVFVANAKVVKAEAGLEQGLEKKCEARQNPATTFPGICTAASLGAVADCAIAAARCQACTKINAFDGLSLSCDLADDGTANASCP
jgi:hypothetical protein